MPLNLLVILPNGSVRKAKNKGPETEPWGTPQTRRAASDITGTVRELVKGAAYKLLHIICLQYMAVVWLSVFC